MCLKVRDSRIEWRLQINWLQKIKNYLLIVDQRYETIRQMKNLDQQGLKEIHLLCSEEDTIWMIDDTSIQKIDIIKDKIKECKTKITTILL